MRRRKTKLLTRLELELMRVIWESDHGPLTVREVADGVNAGRSPPLAYTTVQTMLRILTDKGVLRQRPGPGRAHTFEARVTRDQATSSMVRELVDRLFDGSARPLLVRLIDHESLDRRDLEGLKRLIEEQLGDEEEPR